MSAKRGDAGRRTASGRDRMRGGCRRRDRATNEYPGCQWLTCACSMVDGQLAPRPLIFHRLTRGKPEDQSGKLLVQLHARASAYAAGMVDMAANPGRMSRLDHRPAFPSGLHAAPLIDARSVSFCDIEVLCGGVHTPRNFPLNIASAARNRPSGRHDPLRDSKRFSDP